MKCLVCGQQSEQLNDKQQCSKCEVSENKRVKAIDYLKNKKKVAPKEIIEDR